MSFISTFNHFIRTTILVVGFFFSIIGTNHSHARSWQEIQNSKILRLATEGAYPPFNFFKGKELVGYEVDYAKAIAKELGLTIEWKTLPFDSLLIGLNQDRYDAVIASHSITEERAKTVDFAAPHYCSGGVILTKGEHGPKTAQELTGKTVGTQIGTTYYDRAKSIANLQVKTFPKDTDSLQNLMMGKVDAVITDRFVAIEAKNTHSSQKLVIGEMLFPDKIAAAVKKGHQELLEIWNQAHQKLVNNGTLSSIGTGYFGQSIACESLTSGAPKKEIKNKKK